MFLLNVGLLVRQSARYKQVDYSAPVRAFLLQTEQRYRFIRPHQFLYILPLLAMIGVTGGLVVVDALIPRRVEPSGLTTVIAGYVAFFLGVCAAGFVFTYLDWKRDKGPVIEEIRRLREALEADGERA